MGEYSSIWVIGAIFILILLTIVYMRWISLTEGYKRIKLKRSELTIVGNYEGNLVILYRNISPIDPTILENKLKINAKKKFPNHKLLIFNIPKTPGYNAIHNIRVTTDWARRTIDELKRSMINWLILPLNVSVRFLYYLTQALRQLTMKDKSIVGGILIEKDKFNDKKEIYKSLQDVFIEDYDNLYYKENGFKNGFSPK